MAEINGGVIAARQLKKSGIDTMFGVVAGPMIELFGGGAQEGLKVVGCRHEINGGFMASSLGLAEEEARRAGRRLRPRHDERDHAALRRDGECDAARGVGRIGIRRHARARRIPGAEPSRRREARMQVDGPGRCHRAHRRVDPPRTGKALEGRPGGVYLDFPGHLVCAQGRRGARALLRSRRRVTRMHPDPDAIVRAADLLESAERPLVLIGKGAAWADARRGADEARRPRHPVHHARRWRAARCPTTTRISRTRARSHALKNADVVADVRRPLQLDLRPRPPLRERREGRADRRLARRADLGRRTRVRHRRRRRRRGRAARARASRRRKLRSAGGALARVAARGAASATRRAAREGHPRRFDSDQPLPAGAGGAAALPRDAIVIGGRRDDHGHLPRDAAELREPRAPQRGHHGLHGRRRAVRDRRKARVPGHAERRRARRLRVRRRGDERRDRDARRRAAPVLRRREQRGHRGPHAPGRVHAAGRAAASPRCCPRATSKMAEMVGATRSTWSAPSRSGPRSIARSRPASSRSCTCASTRRPRVSAARTTSSNHEEDSPMPMPLEGIRVLDWTIWQQGPIASSMLADMGADVIKIEQTGVRRSRAGTCAPRAAPRRGGATRTGTSSRTTATSARSRSTSRSPTAARCSTTSRSIPTCSCRTSARASPRGSASTTRRCAQRNPRLIYASATGYGPARPRERRAFVRPSRPRALGHHASRPASPTCRRSASPAASPTRWAASCSPTACMAALFARERTGVGQEVDASHLGSMVFLQGLSRLDEADGGRRHAAHLPRARRQPALEPLPLRATASGSRSRCCSPTATGPDFARAIGRPELATDERFEDLTARAQNAAECVAILDAAFAAKPRAEWLRILREDSGDYIFTIVNTVDDLPSDPQVLANGYVDDARASAVRQDADGRDSGASSPRRRAACARPRPSSASTPRRS